MTLMIDLNAQTERELKRAAHRQGLPPETYAKQLIEAHLPALEEGEVDQATLALLAQWDAEDASTDTAEMKERQKDVADFKRALNANRRHSEGPKARKVYP